MRLTEESAATQEMVVRLAWTDFICIHGDMMAVRDAHHAGMIRCKADGQGVVVRISGGHDRGLSLPL
ncbi:MAG: hypothetical protein AB7E47_11725 [Desulfovibrionaceae bacterium]